MCTTCVGLGIVEKVYATEGKLISLVVQCPENCTVSKMAMFFLSEDDMKPHVEFSNEFNLPDGTTLYRQASPDNDAVYKAMIFREVQRLGSWNLSTPMVAEDRPAAELLPIHKILNLVDRSLV